MPDTEEEGGGGSHSSSSKVTNPLGLESFPPIMASFNLNDIVDALIPSTDAPLMYETESQHVLSYVFRI